MRELVDLYFRQTKGQLAQIEAAVRTNKAGEVRRLAHSCAGASATLGMTRLVPVLRDLERQGAEGSLTNAPQLCQDATARVHTHSEFPGGAPGIDRDAGKYCQFMKKVLIIEDDRMVANVYRNKLVVDGYQAEIALTGEDGLKADANLPA